LSNEKRRVTLFFSFGGGEEKRKKWVNLQHTPRKRGSLIEKLKWGEGGEKIRFYHFRRGGKKGKSSPSVSAAKRGTKLSASFWQGKRSNFGGREKGRDATYPYLAFKRLWGGSFFLLKEEWQSLLSQGEGGEGGKGRIGEENGILPMYPIKIRKNYSS